METLSANYKIRVDDFVCVDFNSFPKLIDALGGVTLDVSRAGAGYINRTVPGVKGKFPWGEGVQLTGEQALLYSRVSLDDGARADRQRAVILAILDRARQSSPGQIVKALGKALRYVYTDLAEGEVDALAKDALTQGWLNYEVAQMRTPALPGEGGRPTGLSADVNGQRVWVVDYESEAKRVQEAIYGYTNILDGKGPGYLAGLFK
jgi:anionic cell wall polymer biosynthesis LytR-Cps2A-Psr (LCP) family protein